jgi:hypothetical protein
METIVSPKILTNKEISKIAKYAFETPFIVSAEEAKIMDYSTMVGRISIWIASGLIQVGTQSFVQIRNNGHMHNTVVTLEEMPATPDTYVLKGSYFDNETGQSKRADADMHIGFIMHIPLGEKLAANYDSAPIITGQNSLNMNLRHPVRTIEEVLKAGNEISWQGKYVKMGEAARLRQAYMINIHGQKIITYKKPRIQTINPSL